MSWTKDDGLWDVTAGLIGFSQPLHEITDDIHRRGWTVNKIQIKDGQYVATGKSPHKDTLEATGRTDATAAANLLVKIMRQEHMRSSSVREKLGAWDHHPIEQQLSQIAQAYAGAPVYEPKAAPAFMELAQDCGRRAQIIRTQLTVEYTDDPVPYESANDMREDVTKKRHIIVTRAYAHHPVWSEQQMLDYRLVVDVLGHTIGGADWGWHGSCLAFAALAPLLAESAQKALFTELPGQAAFGQFYRQWGPQKICFLEDLIEKQQEKGNKPGHTGVHPSQSIAPGALPSIFGKVAMAERSGDPTLDAAMAEFMSQHRGELGDIQDYRHPQVAWGQCEQVAEECARFLKSKGFNADVGDGDLDELGYHGAKPSESVMTPQGPAGEFTYPEHAVVCVYNEHGVVWWTIDFTAAQYGYNEFPKVEPGPPGPLIGPQRQFTSAVVGAPTDPNADWESGVQPLQDNAYLWQRQDGVDPLDAQGLTESLHPLETGLSRMHPEMMKQSVVNALRSSLLGTRNNARGHAVHYQGLMHIPADVDEPMAYQDALEQQREAWNQAQGYAPGSHKQHWPEEQQFKQWVKAANPQLDDGEVQRLAKTELMHMLTEEEEKLLAQDQGEQLTAEVIEHEAYEALKRRLRGLTKPNVDQKVDFGDDHLWHESAGSQKLYHVAPREAMENILANGVDPSLSQHGRWGDQPGFYAFTDPAEAEWYAEQQGNEEPRGPMDVYEVTPTHDLGPGTDPHLESEVYHPQPVPAENVRLHRQMGNLQSPGWSTWKTSTHHADMYPPYLTSRIRPLAQISRHAAALTEAARQDLNHKGHGHQFRQTALNLGIPGLGPRQASHAWLHLAPQTSQLAIVNPEVAETLGHDYASETTNRDYFKHERELAAGRDASGYGHVPLGAFSTGLWDLYAGGPGWHPDRTPFKAHAPTPHNTVDWNAQVPPMTGWTDPYWWNSTQEARDGAAQDFDRSVAVNHSKDEVPFQKSPVDSGDESGSRSLAGSPDAGLLARTASSARSPWVTSPSTGERLTGAPGTSLMQHVKDSLGHGSVQDVWNQDYEVGKGPAATIAKMGAAPRYFHSTQAELQPDDIIRPAAEGYESGNAMMPGYDPQYVYIFDQRHWQNPDADPVYPNSLANTYEVAPLGPIEPDPEGQELRGRYEARHGHPFTTLYHPDDATQPVIPGCPECVKDTQDIPEGPEWYHPYNWRTTHARVIGPADWNDPTLQPGTTAKVAERDPYLDFDIADREEGSPYEGAPLSELYHVTQADPGSIDDWGLEPNHGRVYLTSNPKYWRDEYYGGDPYRAYRVDVRGLPLFHDPTAPHEDYYTPEQVGPERLSPWTE